MGNSVNNSSRNTNPFARATSNEQAFASVRRELSLAYMAVTNSAVEHLDASVSKPAPTPEIIQNIGHNITSTPDSMAQNMSNTVSVNFSQSTTAGTQQGAMPQDQLHSNKENYYGPFAA
jgi:hypothetical protein